MAKPTTGNRTERLSIRILQDEDVEPARLLHNDDSTLLRLNDPQHVSQAQQEGWFQALSKSRTSRRYAVRETATGEFVGVFRIDEIDEINGSACVGLDITAEKRGNGYAPEIYGYFFDYFFEQRHLHRLYLAVLEINDVARNLYTKLGFTEEGRSREALFRDGAYRDLIWMSLLRPGYVALRDGQITDKQDAP
jgi:RimJ/RimL family protein N-acetyltransferase